LDVLKFFIQIQPEREDHHSGGHEAGAPEKTVPARMVGAGVSAFVAAKAAGCCDPDLVMRVYAAMKSEDRSSDLIGEFARETIYNIRDVMEDLKKCAERAESHFADISNRS